MNLAEIAGRLEENFGVSVEVTEVRHAAKGHNSQSHFEVKTREGRRFGLKAAGDASRVEVVASRIAKLLDAPNAAEAKLDGAGRFPSLPQLQQSAVAKTEWMAGAVGDLTEAATLASIRENLETFGLQYGEWAALALFLGVADRDNRENWVWDADRKKLAMIDFEFCFMTERSAISLARLIIRDDVAIVDRALWKEGGAQGFPGLRLGFAAMRTKIRARLEPVLELVRAEFGNQSYVKWAAEYAAMSDEAALAEIEAAL